MDHRAVKARGPAGVSRQGGAVVRVEEECVPVSVSEHPPGAVSTVGGRREEEGTKEGARMGDTPPTSPPPRARARAAPLLSPSAHSLAPLHSLRVSPWPGWPGEPPPLGAPLDTLGRVRKVEMR